MVMGFMIGNLFYNNFCNSLKLLLLKQYKYGILFSRLNKKIRMGKKLYLRKIKKSMIPILSESILPFEEKPSSGCFEKQGKNQEENIGAHDLFSYFTADIIKEKIIFTR